MRGQRTNQRSRLVVEPEIQYALVGQLCWQWCMHLIASLMLLAMLQVLLGGFFRPWNEHLEQIWPTLASLTIAMVCLLPVYIHSSLKLSNRFVGPIHRFRNELRAIANGQEYSPIKFRDQDYWPTFSKEFDMAISALQARAKEAAQNEQNEQNESDAKNEQQEISTGSNGGARSEGLGNSQSSESSGAPGGGVVFPGTDSSTATDSPTK